MTVGERIKQKRIELNLSQDELAKRVGYKSRSSIQKIECARSLPLSKVAIMATALECSPSQLMGWTDMETFDNSAQFEKKWSDLGGRHPLELTDTEQKIIINYRASDPGIQESVLKLLDIKKEDAPISTESSEVTA